MHEHLDRTYRALRYVYRKKVNLLTKVLRVAVAIPYTAIRFLISVLVIIALLVSGPRTKY